MKQKFSPQWQASSQPRKQKKYRANAPLHLRNKLMSAHLSKDLRKKHNIRSFPIRKGDTVKIMRGEYDGKTGKIALVNLKKLKTTIEGIQRQKRDGTKVKVWFDPSTLLIQDLVLEDKRRLEALNRSNKNKTETNTVKQENKQEKKQNAPNKK